MNLDTSRACNSDKDIFVVAAVATPYIAFDFADQDPYIHAGVTLIVCGMQRSIGRGFQPE